MRRLPRQLTVKQVSEEFNIPEWTIRSYISKRIIPHRRLGRKIYIPTEKFEAWLSRGDVEPQSEVMKNEIGD